MAWRCCAIRVSINVFRFQSDCYFGACPLHRPFRWFNQLLTQCSVDCRFRLRSSWPHAWGNWACQGPPSFSWRNWQPRSSRTAELPTGRIRSLGSKLWRRLGGCDERLSFRFCYCFSRLGSRCWCQLCRKHSRSFHCSSTKRLPAALAIRGSNCRVPSRLLFCS